MWNPRRSPTLELENHVHKICFYRRLARLFPDWLFAPRAYRDLTRYIDNLIEKTLALPINNQADSKTQKEFNLVEDLVATHPNDRYFIRGQLMAVLMASKVNSGFQYIDVSNTDDDIGSGCHPDHLDNISPGSPTSPVQEASEGGRRAVGKSSYR